MTTTGQHNNTPEPLLSTRYMARGRSTGLPQPLLVTADQFAPLATGKHGVYFTFRRQTYIRNVAAPTLCAAPVRYGWFCRRLIAASTAV